MKIKGFTLIEFVIVSLIVVIISMVLVRSFFTPSDSALEIASKKIYFDLSYAREQAMMTSKRHKVYINTPDRIRIGFGNYSLILNPDNSRPFDVNVSKIYPEVAFFKNYSVRFDPLGRNEFKSQTSIMIISGSRSKLIKIIPETGNIYVQ